MNNHSFLNTFIWYLGPDESGQIGSRKQPGAFRQKITRYLARRIGEFEAEDLTQEVFVRANQNLPSFRGESRLLTWIHRIATNTAIDRMRQPSFRRAAQDPSLDRPETNKGEIEDQDVWTGESAPSLNRLQSIHIAASNG